MAYNFFCKFVSFEVTKHDVMNDNDRATMAAATKKAYCTVLALLACSFGACLCVH